MTSLQARFIQIMEAWIEGRADDGSTLSRLLGLYYKTKPQPMREEIAEIVRHGVCRVCKLPYPQHVKGKDADHNFYNDAGLVADAILGKTLR